MEKTASQIQKERIKELKDKADALIARCDVATLTSINEKGYPRTCVLSIAKADQQKKEGNFLDLVFGLTDVSAILFFILPLFAKVIDGGAEAVSLFALTGIAVYLKLAYFSLVGGLMGMGVLTLAMQNCKGAFWIKWKHGMSLMLGGAGVMLFSVSRQPYAAVFLCLFLILKALLLLKKG